MYHIRILDRDRQIQAILPDVRWNYTRRINEATEITIQIPRETVGEYITPGHVLFGFFSPAQPFAVGTAPVSTRPDKAQYAEIAAFVQVYQGTQLKASGCITGREIGQIITIKAMTEEILLESNITPAQYGRVWDGWDLADVAKDLLNGWRSIRVKAQSQWQSYMVASSHVDLNTEPGVVMLAKGGTGAYYESGYITLRFQASEVEDFLKWDRVRWSADSNDVVQTSIQISYDGSTWSEEIDGGLPEEIGYALGSSASQVYVRINLHTTDTESEDPNGNPVGVTPYVFALELIARTEGDLVAGSIPPVAGVTVKGLEADHANALQVLIDACEQNSWEFAVWNGALSIAESLGVNRVAEFVLRTGTNIEVTSLGDDDSELCNILTATGPGQGINRLEVTLRDDESIGAYGDYPQAIEFDVASLDELEQAAWNYLDTHNTPKTRFSVRAAFDCESEPNYGLGDVVRVADPDTGIITTTRIMTESREYSASGLSVRLDLGRARLNLQAVLDGRERLPKPVDPLTPVGVYARGVFKGLVVGCSEPKGSWSHTECHISTAKGFEPGSATLVDSGKRTRFDVPSLAPGVRYYARLIHVDGDGRKSEPSREVSAVTLYIHVEDLDQAPPDTPVWDTCEFVREIVLRWHPAARAAEYEIRESDSGWGEAAGQVWRGNATTVTLAPTKRSHTYYIRAISAAGVYSLDAAPITLTNATPSTPPQPTVQEFFSCLWITINPVADNDIVSYNLYMTPVDESGDPTGDTQVTTYLSAGRVTYNASPGTRFRVEVAAADVLGEGGKSTPIYAATNSLAEADIPEGIIGESKLTEELMTEIESAVDGVDYLDGQMSEAQQRLSQAESELDSIDGRVTDTETKITELEGEIATKVSQTDHNTLVGRVETAETNIAQNAQAIATKASQSSVDVLDGRVSAAESTITQHSNAISSVVSEVESIDGRVKTAESAITQLGSEITLKVQVRQDGKLVIAGIGMAVDEDGQSEVAILADRFRVLTSVNGEMKSVFAVDTETGKVYVLGDLIATGLIRATEVQAEVAKHLLLAAQVATVDHLGALKIEAGAITVGGSAPGISLTKPEGARLWHFDGSLVSTDGIAPVGTPVATLRPDGRFGGAVAVEEGTTNLIPSPRWFRGSRGQSSDWCQRTVYSDHHWKVEATGTANGQYEYYYPLVQNVTPNTEYTFSFRVRQCVVGHEIKARVRQGDNQTILIERHITAADVGKIVSLTVNSGDNTSLTPAIIITVNTGQYTLLEISDIQFEAKPFATSFVDGTRAAGYLKYQTGLPIYEDWTVAAWFMSPVGKTTNWQDNYLFSVTDGGNRLDVSWDPSQERIRLNCGGTWKYMSVDSPGLPNEPYFIVLRNNSGKLILDVMSRFGISSQVMGDIPEGLNPNLVFDAARYWGGGNLYTTSLLIDELLILPYAATPEQIQAWYAMGAPFHDPQERIGDERIPSASRWDAGIAEALSELADLSSEVSAKVTIFYQPDQPTAKAIGDIWYDTDADPVTIKRWNGTQWIDITTTALSAALAAAGDAQATADGKIMTFAQASAPQATAIGDLWIDTSDDNKLYRWSGSAWVDVADMTPIDADERPISAASGQVYIGEPGIAVANGAMIFVSGTFSHDQLGRLITAAVDRPLTTDPGGQKSISAPVEISAARGAEIYKGKLNVWAGTGGAGDTRYIHDGRVTDDGIIGMDARKLTNVVPIENLPGHLIRTAPGLDGAVMYWGDTYVAGGATVNVTFTAAMPYTPKLMNAWEIRVYEPQVYLQPAWFGLYIENISKTGFRLRNSDQDVSGTIRWMFVCASADPSTSSCDNCQEECQGDCQQYGCQDSCQTGVCQLTCESDCQTTCEGSCQTDCMVQCQPAVCQITCQYGIQWT